MKTTSHIVSSDVSPLKHSGMRKMASVFVFAIALAVAPAPAFAQHGGGGGGGSHGGGGGASHGGGSGSGGGGSHAAASSGAHSTRGSSSNSSGGHWWNPFHGAASAAKGTNSTSTTTGASGSQGRNSWQEPPSSSANGSVHGSVRPNFYSPANVNSPATATPSGRLPAANNARSAMSSLASTRGATVGAPPHEILPHRPGFPFSPFNPFFFNNPFFFGSGFGFGFGGFGPCDPFWGCYGYGYGIGGGYGYYGGGFSGGYSADMSYDSPDDWAPSQEPNPTLFAAPADNGSGQGDNTTAQKPYAIIYMKDGSSYAVTDYWLANGKLHYVTSYGGENAIDQSQLDLQRTVDQNAANGTNFILRPEPANPPTASPVPPALDSPR
jgi:hypothetical protein